MKGAKIFQRICKCASLDNAVSALTDAELSAVAEYLSDLRPTGGIPAQVFGMVSARLSGKEAAK